MVCRKKQKENIYNLTAFCKEDLLSPEAVPGPNMERLHGIFPVLLISDIFREPALRYKFIRIHEMFL